jgi:hypothetical protein
MSALSRPIPVEFRPKISQTVPCTTPRSLWNLLPGAPFLSQPDGVPLPLWALVEDCDLLVDEFVHLTAKLLIFA